MSDTTYAASDKLQIYKKKSQSIFIVAVNRYIIPMSRIVC